MSFFAYLTFCYYVPFSVDASRLRNSAPFRFHLSNLCYGRAKQMIPPMSPFTIIRKSNCLNRHPHTKETAIGVILPIAVSFVCIFCLFIAVFQPTFFRQQTKPLSACRLLWQAFLFFSHQCKILNTNSRKRPPFPVVAPPTPFDLASQYRISPIICITFIPL